MKSLYLIFILVFGSDKVGSYPQESRQLENQDENVSNFTTRQNGPPPYAQLQQPMIISQPWYKFPNMDQRIPLKWSYPLQSKLASFQEPRKDGLSYLTEQEPEDMPISNEGLPSRFFGNYYENPFYGGKRFYKPEPVLPAYQNPFPEAGVNQPNTSTDRPHKNQKSESSNLEPDVTLALTEKASAIKSHSVVVTKRHKVRAKPHINNAVVPDYKNGSNEHTYSGESFESYESPNMKSYLKTPKPAKRIEYKVRTRPPNTKLYVVPFVPSNSPTPLSGPNLKQEISNNINIKRRHKLTDNVQSSTQASDNDSEYIDSESEGLEMNESTTSTWVTTTSPTQSDTVPTPIVEASGLNVIENSFEQLIKAIMDDSKELAEPNEDALFDPSGNFSTKNIFYKIKEKRNVRLEPSLLNNLKDANYHIYEKNTNLKIPKMDIPEEYEELTEAGITEYMSSPNIIKPTGTATEYATVPMKQVNTDYSSKAPQIVKTTPIKKIETNKPYTSTANAKGQVNSQTNNQPNSQVSSHARVETYFKSVDKANIVPSEISYTNGAPITITSRTNRPVKKTYRRTEKNPVRPVVYSFRNKNGTTVVIPINVTENPIKPFVEYPLLPIPLINIPIPKEHPNKDNVKKEKVEPGSTIYSESAKIYDFASTTNKPLGDNEATSKEPTKMYSSRLVRKMSNEDKDSFVPIIATSSYKAPTQSDSATTPVYTKHGESKSTIASKIETTDSPQTNVVTDQYYYSTSFSTYNEAKENGIKTINVNNPPENIIEPKPSTNVYDDKSTNHPDSITPVEYNTSEPDIKKPQTNYYEVTSTEIPKVTPVEQKVNIHIITIHPNDTNGKETLNNTTTTRQTDKSEIIAPEPNYEDSPTPSPATKPYAYHTDNKPTETNIYKTSTGQKVGNPVVFAQPNYDDEPAPKLKSNYIDNKTIDVDINTVSTGQNIDMHDAPKPYQYHDDKPTYIVNTTRVESNAVAHVTGQKNPYQDEGKTTDKPINSNLEYRFDKYLKHTSKTYDIDDRDYESITLPPYDEVKTTKTSIYTKSLDHNADKPDILTTKPNTFDVITPKTHTTSAPFEHKTDKNYDKFANVLPHKEYQYDNVQTTNESIKNTASESRINEPEVMKTQPYKTTKSPITEADDTKMYPRTSQLFKLFSFLLSGITKSSSDEAVTTETDYYSSTKAPVIESKSISKAEAKVEAGKPEENSPIANKNDKITTVDSISNIVVSPTIVTTENLDEKVAVDAIKKIDKPETLPPIVNFLVKSIESHTSDEETEYIKSSHELVEKSTPMKYTVFTAVDSIKSDQTQRKETKGNKHSNPTEFNNKTASAISKASTLGFVKKLDKRNIVPATEIPVVTSKPTANDSIKNNIDISKMKGETETFSINSPPQKPTNKGLSGSNHYRSSTNARKAGNHHVDRAVKRDSKTKIYQNGTIVEEFTEVKENDKGNPTEIRKTLIFRYPGEYK